MRIALVTDGIWPYVLGGMQKHSYYLCKYFALNKIQVDLFHYNQSDYDISKLEFFTEEERSYIRSIQVPMPKAARFPGHYLWDSYRYSKSVYAQILPSISDYDFIYTKGFAGWYLINQKKSGAIKCAPIGIKFHGYEMFQRSPDVYTKLQHLFLLRYPTAQLTKKADVVFSYGGKITDLIKALGVSGNKIIELPSGVEANTLVDAARKVSQPIQFLFLGRYERRKGIEEYNTAITKVLSEVSISNVQFNFIGPIPEDRQLNFAQVKYYGEIRDKAQLQALVRSQDVLVCPSWSEGLPNVILEAMAAGLAVLATDVGASSVLVNDQTGWLLKDSNPDELATYLTRISKLPASAIESKKAGALDHIRAGFTWEILFSKLKTALIEKMSPSLKQAQ